MTIRLLLTKCAVLIMTAGTLLSGMPAQAAFHVNSPDADSITLGIYQPPTVDYGKELNQVNTLAGKKHGIAMIYTDFSQPFSTYKFLVDQINTQMAAGDRPVVMFSMGPVNGRQALGCDRDYGAREAVPPSSIIAGVCDRYLAAFAQGMKAMQVRFLMNYAHEMNSTSQPWSPTNFGQPPSTYVQMYRKVKSIFDAQGATNVEWVWAPIYQSNPNTPANNPNAYYPGNEYVHWVAVSGYNYYNQMPGAPQPWNSFTTIFDAVLKDFACRYAKPQLINEFGTIDGGGAGKAAWISDAYAQMSKYPFLRGAIWYNDVDNGNGSIDFRITSNTAFNGSVSPLPAGSGAWTNAYKSAVASGTFISTLPGLKDITPATTNCNGTITPTPNPNVKPRVRLPVIVNK